MPTITRLQAADSIKAGPGSTILADGTIRNPEPYRAVNITFDNGRTIQVERPLTPAKIQAALAATPPAIVIDNIAEGQVI